MVRVPRGEYHFIARALDVGALGVMVPMVGTAAEAAHIVSCARYPPQGRRGAAFGFAHDDYQGGDVRDKIAALHARTLLIAQIETAEGLANVEAIAAVPGIDVLWLGHFDLTNSWASPARSTIPITWPRSSASSPRAIGTARPPRSSPPTSARRAMPSRVVSGCSRYGIDHLMLQDALRAGLADPARRESTDGSTR